MNRLGYIGVATVLAIGVLVLPVAAHDDNEIVIANQVVLRVRVAPEGMTVRERTLIVERRLVNVLSYEELSPPDVQIKGNPKWPGIWVGSHLLITVTAPDAEANKATPIQLAKMWAENVRRQLPQAEPLTRFEGPCWPGEGDKQMPEVSAPPEWNVGAGEMAPIHLE